MKLKDYQDRLRIDKHNLDEELIQQPELFYRVSHMYSSACSDKDMFKESLEVMETKLFNKLRKEADALPGRTTDSSIRSKVSSMKEVIGLRTAYKEAKHRAEELLPLKEAYEQRGYALKELCNLYSSNYFQAESGGKRKDDAMEATANRNRREAGKLRKELRSED